MIGFQEATPDSKVHGANMGVTRVLSAPDGPHVGPLNLAIRDSKSIALKQYLIDLSWWQLNHRWQHWRLLWRHPLIPPATTKLASWYFFLSGNWVISLFLKPNYRKCVHKCIGIKSFFPPSLVLWIPHWSMRTSNHLASHYGWPTCANLICFPKGKQSRNFQPLSLGGVSGTAAFSTS